MAYQQVMASVELKGDTPADVIQLLNSRINGTSLSVQLELDKLRFSSALLNASWTGGIFSLCSLQWDFMAERYFLTINSQTQNHDNIIEPFFAWIATYSDQDGIIGYVHVGDFQTTRLIHFEEGKAYWVSVEEKERTEMERPDS